MRLHGQALLEGWIASGVKPEATRVQDPTPSDWLKAQTGFHLNQALPAKQRCTGNRNGVNGKGGTTAEALKHLMAPGTGLFDLTEHASSASRDKSIEPGAK